MAELREMSNDEYVHWCMYYGILGQRQEMAELKAKAARG